MRNPLDDLETRFLSFQQEMRALVSRRIKIPAPAPGGSSSGTVVGGGDVANFAHAFNGGTPATTGDFRAFGGTPSGY